MAVYFWIATESSSTPVGVWDSNSNWSFTEGGSSAGSYPGQGDVAIIPSSAVQDIILMGSFSNQLGMYIQRGSAGFYFDDYGSVSAKVFVFEEAGSIGNGYVTLYGNFVFSQSGIVNANISGNCLFNATSQGYSTLTGDCLFTNWSGNSYGYIYGNSLFTDNSSNSGSVYGTATFNGRGSTGAYNTGTVNGLELKLPENYSQPGYPVRPLDILGAGI